MSGKKFGSFQLINEVKSLIGEISIRKYKSLRTGLQVTLADVLGPLVQGFFTVATETDSDDGLPHTLEHLVFLGSDDYPYKGVLDLLANRCNADGTNAWTSTDHTSYTVMTAGKFGFLNLLPIYLDHLLYPTLTDTAFTTEIYHITETGEDAGVVYSEMQAVENEGSSVVYKEIMRMLYPHPSGYRYETGGIMANLRESTTNEKIRAYHRKTYQPENLHLIITGQVGEEEVFKAIQSVEDKIISKGKGDIFTKPWQSEVPPFDRTVSKNIIYPSDMEDTGIIAMGWRGPSVIENFFECQSLEALLEYLTETSVAPIPKVIIDVEDPLACEVDAEILNYSTSSMVLTFSGTPKDKIPDVESVVMETLDKIVRGQLEFDMATMADTLKKLIVKRENAIETSPHSVMASCVIQDFLYGQSNEYLSKIVNQRSSYEHLLNEPRTYWINLIDKYFLSAPRAVVRGIPSIDRSEELQEQEESRHRDRRERLGANALQKFGQTLEHAKKMNEVKPHPSLVEESLNVASTDGIAFHARQTFSNIANICELSSIEAASVFDLAAVPVRMHLVDAKSNFVEVVAILHTQGLSSEQRMYLPLLLDLLLESPILKEDGRQMPYEEVVKTLNADTVEAGTSSDLSLSSSEYNFGEFFHYVGINLKVEMAKYVKGVEWLEDILFRVVLNTERASVKATKLLNSIGDLKRSGGTMLSLMSNEVTFNAEAGVNRTNVLRQEKFLTQLCSSLKSNGDGVLAEMIEVYRIITSAENITINLATDFRKLSQLSSAVDPWLSFGVNKESRNSESCFDLSVTYDWEKRLAFGDCSSPFTGHIAGLGSLESAYLIQNVASITDFNHPDLPALRLAISYLNQSEGPMWKNIRGKGLAYDYGICLDVDEGVLCLRLAQASQLFDAYVEACAILTSHLNERSSWDKRLFDSAKSCLVYHLIEKEAEICDVVQQCLYSLYRKVPYNYNRLLLSKLEGITLEDMATVADRHLRPLTDPTLGKLVAVCPSSKLKSFADKFKKCGHRLEVISSLEKSHFSKL